MNWEGFKVQSIGGSSNGRREEKRGLRSGESLGPTNLGPSCLGATHDECIVAEQQQKLALASKFRRVLVSC